MSCKGVRYMYIASSVNGQDEDREEEEEVDVEAQVDVDDSKLLYCRCWIVKVHSASQSKDCKARVTAAVTR